MSDDEKRDFLKINLGHVLTIGVYLMTVGFMYGQMTGKIDKHDLRIVHLERERERDNTETMHTIRLLEEIRNDTKWLKEQQKETRK